MRRALLYSAGQSISATGQQVSQLLFASTPEMIQVALLAFQSRTVEGNHPKTNVVVPVVRVIVVAVRHARVVPIVVPRAAAQAL